MNASAAVFAAAFAISSAGVAGDIPLARTAPEPDQAPQLSLDIGRVEVCTLAVDGMRQRCQFFDARELEEFVIGVPTRSAQASQVAFIDPVTHQPASPTEEQLAEQREVAFLEETQVGGNEPLALETLADGTMMVRVGNRFHAQLSAVLSKDPARSASKIEAVKP